MSDCGDDDDSISAPSLNDVAIPIDIRSLHQPVIDMVSRGWLKIPAEFIEPKKMCAVNQFVHVVSELDDTFFSTSCELVLVGTGNSIPEHFRYMIYCMEMVSP
jgi:hypothetical protein